LLREVRTTFVATRALQRVPCRGVSQQLRANYGRNQGESATDSGVFNLDRTFATNLLFAGGTRPTPVRRTLPVRRENAAGLRRGTPEHRATRGSVWQALARWHPRAIVTAVVVVGWRYRPVGASDAKDVN